MWLAWQTPWNTSGMQTGGTRCLSATWSCHIWIIWKTLFLLHLFFKHTLRIGDGGLETNNYCVFIESRIFGWFPMQQSCLHIPDVPDGDFECNNFSKEVPTWRTCWRHFQREPHWWRPPPPCQVPRSRARSCLRQGEISGGGSCLCTSNPPRLPTCWQWKPIIIALKIWDFSWSFFACFLDLLFNPSQNPIGNIGITHLYSTSLNR